MGTYDVATNRERHKQPDYGFDASRLRYVRPEVMNRDRFVYAKWCHTRRGSVYGVDWSSQASKSQGAVVCKRMFPRSHEAVTPILQSCYRRCAHWGTSRLLSRGRVRRVRWRWRACSATMTAWTGSRRRMLSVRCCGRDGRYSQTLR